MVRELEAMHPAEHVRRYLEAARARGKDFDTAWKAALRWIPPEVPERERWRSAFKETEGAWRSAYHLSSTR